MSSSSFSYYKYYSTFTNIKTDIVFTETRIATIPDRAFGWTKAMNEVYSINLGSQVLA